MTQDLKTTSDAVIELARCVEDSMETKSNPRIGELLKALVRHLYSFIQEMKVNEEEFECALAFIRDIGQQTNDSHNEVMLAADVLGLSTLVSLLNNPQNLGQSAAALLGPFWRLNAPRLNNGANIATSHMDFAALKVTGTVRTVHGKPIASALVDVWQASPVGLYENQDPEQPDMNFRGSFTTDAAGKYEFNTVKPAGYPVPTHGRIGELLSLQNRHPFRPAHIHFMVSAPGYRTLITQVFSSDSPHLESDVVFGVSKPLIGLFTEHADHAALQYDFVLEAGRSEFPEPPIK